MICKIMHPNLFSVDMIDIIPKGRFYTNSLDLTQPDNCQLTKDHVIKSVFINRFVNIGVW